MSYSLKNTLVIGVSSTALFDLSKSDKLFKQLTNKNKDKSIYRYRKYMKKMEGKDLNKGIAYPLIEALLNLNKYKKEDEKSHLVEVIIMSKNSPSTGISVLNNIKKNGLNITRSVFTGGESTVDYLEALNIDLFLTTDEKDAQNIIDSDICACAILSVPPKYYSNMPKDKVRIAFDGDAVLFNDESEVIYKKKGMKKFHKNEEKLQNTPLKEGPFANFLKKLSKLQNRLPMRVEYSPIRIVIVTSRNSPSDMRVIKTLRNWGVYVDEAFFLGGLEKTSVLKAFNPHIFFDDQDVHLEKSSLVVPSGKVLYRSDSPLSKIKSKRR